MRAALICLAPPGEAAALIAGRSAAACQLELALACDCAQVIVHGHGASAEAISLRHRAERAGVRFQTVNDARALIGAASAGDSLLVLQAGLWAEAESVLDVLRGPAGVLVLPAGVGVQAGFERIDLDRAWAGALVLPGELLGALGGLPEDIAPAPALLRIALQHRLPETRMPAQALDDGGWSLLRSPEAARQHEARWLRKVVGEQQGGAVSARLANAVLHRSGGALAAHPRSFATLLAGLMLVLAGAVLAAWFAQPLASFALLALAAPLGEMTLGLARVRAPPYGQSRRWHHLRHLIDGVLAGCGILVIDGLIFRTLFAPLVLVAALRLLDRQILPASAALLRDRGAAALALMALLLVLPPEPSIMLIAGIILLANLVFTAKLTRI